MGGGAAGKTIPDAPLSPPECEPVWPSGKALGLVSGRTSDSASALLSLQKGCGLWTLSCDFVNHFLLKH